MYIFSKWPMLGLGAILLAAAALAGLGIYFLVLSGKTGTENYSFLSNMYALRRRFSDKRDTRPWAVIYVGLSLHKLRNVHSQVEAENLYTYVKQRLLQKVHTNADEMIANYDGKNFLILTRRTEKSFQTAVDEFFEDFERHGAVNGIVHLPDVRFGYFSAKSNDVSFDNAVSRAKQAYKHAETAQLRGCVWDYELIRGEEDVEELERLINTAIDEDKFVMEFQPFVDIKTQTVIGGEVLTRLHLPNRSLVSPARFLRAIAGVGIYCKFDYYVFDKCCAWASFLVEQESQLKHLSCNFSRYTLSQPNFAQEIIRIADRHQVPHGILDIEITEEEQELASDVIRANLEQLRQAGFSIFLDDFGCGYTSFSDLQNYCVDVVKVDRSILQQASTEKGRIIFEEMVQMIKKLGCTVLSEGVETLEELEFVKRAGCDIVQGYYYYKALPAEEFRALLAPENYSKPKLTVI